MQLRPPRELLKKIYLKVLYQKKNNYYSEDLNFISVICTILIDHFRISELSEQDFNNIIKSVDELETEGYIQQDISYGSSKRKILTDKGINYVENFLLNFESPSFEINNFITREDLRDECLEDYANGDYETAIFKAFRLLEEVSRGKTITNSSAGKEYLSNSFISVEGHLVGEDRSSLVESGSLHRIMLGSMMWFNRQSKSSKFNEAEAAVQILLFANLHLNLIDQKEVIT